MWSTFKLGIFSRFQTPIASIASTFSVPQQQFADDSQLYISLSASNFSSQINCLEECLTALHAWCCHNSLSLNPDKSDSVLFGTRQRAHSFSDITTVNVAGSVVPMADHVKLLGVTLDNHLSMDKHVNEVSRACFYHLRALRHVRPAITASDANMIACSVVGSRLDYANAVLYGVSSKNIQRLQRIQNALARCVVDSKVHRSSNALLKQLHWLPIHQRIDFKLVKLAFLARSSATSSYLNSSVSRYLRDVRFALKILACSLFLGRRQFLVRAHFASLRRPCSIHFLRILDLLTISPRFVAF